MKVFEKTNLILFGLIALLAYVTAQGTLRIAIDISLGSIIRNYIPAIGIGVILILMLLLKEKKISKDFIYELPLIDYKSLSLTLSISLILSLIMAVIIMVSVSSFGIGLLEFSVGLVILILVALSSYFIIGAKTFYGMSVFILNYPLIVFLHYILSGTNNINIESIEIHLSFIILLFAFFIWLPSLLLAKKRASLNLTFLSLTVALFAISILLSVVMSDNIVKGLNTYIAYVLPFTLCFFIISSSRISTNIKEIKVLVFSILASSIFFIFISFYLFYRKFGILSFNPAVIYNKTYEFPTFFMGSGRVFLLLYCAPFTYLFWEKNKGNTKRILWGLLTLLIIGFLILQQARVGILTAGLLFFFLLGRRKKNLIIVALLLIAVMLLFPPLLKKSMPRVYEFIENPSIGSIRLGAFKASTYMIKDHPFSGIGYGMWNNYIHLYGTPYVIYNDGYGNMVTSYVGGAHNQLLSYFAEVGLIGLLSWLLLLYAGLRETMFIYRKTKSVFINSVSLAILFGFIGIFISGMVGIDPIKDSPVYFGLFLGLIPSLKNRLMEI